MLHKTVVVGGSEGIHARPATELVRTANGFASETRLKVGGRTVNAKSVLSVMSLAIRPGTPVDVETDGPDAGEAMDAICRLLSGE